MIRAPMERTDHRGSPEEMELMVWRSLLTTQIRVDVFSVSQGHKVRQEKTAHVALLDLMANQVETASQERMVDQARMVPKEMPAFQGREENQDDQVRKDEMSVRKWERRVRRVPLDHLDRLEVVVQMAIQVHAENRDRLVASVRLARTDLPEKEGNLDNQEVGGFLVRMPSIVLVHNVTTALRHLATRPHRSNNIAAAVFIKSVEKLCVEV